MLYKKIFFITFLTFLIGFGAACNPLGTLDDDLDDVALYTLIGGYFNSCTVVPATIVDDGVTWNCSANNLTVTCVSDATSVTYTYPSIGALTSSLFYSPGLVSRQPIALRVSNIVLSTTPTTLTYTLDNLNRLTNISVDNPASNLTFSNYDSNGFPQSMGGDTTATATYSYSTGATRPDKIVMSGGLTDVYNFTGGVLTSYNIGAGEKTVESAGFFQVCP